MTSNWYRDLTAAYPRDFSTTNEGQVALWAKTFANTDPIEIRSAIDGWINESRHAPKIADIHERIRANRTGSGPRAGRQCGRCDHGWIETAARGRGTWRRCPNGCTPPVDAQRSPIAATQRTPEHVAQARQHLGGTR